MKRTVSLLVVMAMILTTFAGWSLVAASPADAFIATFDEAFGPAIGATAPVTRAFEYNKGDEARATGWIGGVFDASSTLVYTINDGAEGEIPMIAAEEGVVNAIKGAYADATFFSRFDVNIKDALAAAHVEGTRSTIRLYIKRPDNSKFLFATFTAKAPELPFESDDTHAYKLSETAIALQSCVEITPSEGGEYVSVITKAGNPQDPYFGIVGLNVPSDYKYMAVKYACASNTKIEGNNHYIATAKLSFGQPGSYTTPDMLADNAWHLKIYDVTTSFTGVGSDPITMVRLLPGNAIDKEVRFAYVAFFKSEADAQAYDTEYCERYTLNDMDPPERTEVIPNALEKVPEYTFDFDALEAGYDLLTPYGGGANPFRSQWTPTALVETGGSFIKVMEDNSAGFHFFSQAKFDDRWKGASEISFDLKANVAGKNFCGFYVRSGAEGSIPLYENDGARADSQNSTTGTTGVGFSFRNLDSGKQGIEIFVKYFDNDLNKLQVKGHIFENVIENAAVFHSYKVVDDDAGTISFYIDGTLFAKVTYANAKMTESPMYSEKYYSKAQILDASGAVLETVENALISTQSTIGLGTRAETLYVDNIKLTQYTPPVAEKTISTNKTTYAVGEPIKVTYNGAVRENSDWLCIYAGAESTYGEPGGPTSIQYAYIGGNGTVVFNDINNKVSGNDRTALHSSLDVAYNETDKIFYQVQSTAESLATLAPGTYHVLILGGGSWYDVESSKIVFTVEEGPVSVTSLDEISQPGEYKLAGDIAGTLTIEDGEYTIDLNGFTWDGGLSIKGGNVTINDSSEEKTGVITSSTSDVIELPAGSTAELTLNEIMIVGTASGCDGVFVRAGKVTINNCFITAVSSAVQNRTAAGEIIINDGLYYSANNALKLNDNATITINKGIFVGAFLVGDAATRPEGAPTFVAGPNTIGFTEEVEIPELGTVTASIYYIIGDVDGDDKVDGTDVTLLLQYLAEWDVEIDELNADVNCDGVVDGKDATLLLQYMADWEVELGPQTAA